MIRPFQGTRVSITMMADRLKLASSRRRAMKTKNWNDAVLWLQKMPALRDDRDIWKHVFKRVSFDDAVFVSLF